MKFQFKGKEYFLPTNLKDISFRQFALLQIGPKACGIEMDDNLFPEEQNTVAFMNLFTGIPMEEIASEMHFRELKIFAGTASDALRDSYNRIEPAHQFELFCSQYTTQWPQVEGAKFAEHEQTLEIRAHLMAWTMRNDWMRMAKALGLLIRYDGYDGRSIGEEEVLLIRADKICAIVKGMEDAAIAYGWLMRNEAGKTVIA